MNLFKNFINMFTKYIIFKAVDDSANQRAIAPVFDKEKSYVANEFCTQGGFLWKAAHAIPAGKDFDESDWIESNVMSDSASSGNVKSVMGKTGHVILDVETDLAGYKKTTIDSLLAGKAAAGSSYSKAEEDGLLAGKRNLSDSYSKDEVDAAVNSKISKPATSGAPNYVLALDTDGVTPVWKAAAGGNVESVNGKVGVVVLEASDVGAYTTSQVDSIAATKANTADIYNKSQIDTALSAKANTGDSYLKSEEDTLLAAKMNAADGYTKTQTDSLLAGKEDLGYSYSKAESNTLLADKVNTADMTSALALKANTADVYDKAAVDSKVDAKLTKPTTAGAANYTLVLDTDGVTPVWKEVPCKVRSVNAKDGDVILYGDEIKLEDAPAAVTVKSAIDSKVKAPVATGTAGMFLALDTDGVSTIWKTAGSATAPVTSVNGMLNDVVLDSNDIKINKSDASSITIKQGLTALESAVGNVYTKSATDTLLSAKADKTDVYTRSETDTELAKKTDKPTTAGTVGQVLSLKDATTGETEWKNVTIPGTFVTDINGMTGSVEIDGSEITVDKTTPGSDSLNTAINKKIEKPDSSVVPGKVIKSTGSSGYAWQNESITDVNGKSGSVTLYGSDIKVHDGTGSTTIKESIDLIDIALQNTYTKSETYSRTDVNSLLSNKADKTDTYTKSEVFTKTETNTELAKKIDKPATTVAAGNIPVSNGSGDVTWRAESVLSVNGKTGAITLNNLDVNAASSTHNHNLSDVVDAGDIGYLNKDTAISTTPTDTTAPTSKAVADYAAANYVKKPSAEPAASGYVLATAGPSSLETSWVPMGGSTSSAVLSVNSMTGVVVLTGENTKTTSDAASNTIAADIATLNTEVAAKYEKPSTGITKSDLATAVQSSLDKADTAYQKAATGIPSTDMTTAVQNSLSKADTALQPSDISDWAKAANKPTYTYTEVGAAAATHTHLATDITNLGAAALLDTSSSVSSHSADKIYTSEAVYNNFLKNDATAAANVITAASSSATGLEIKNNADSKKVDIASDSVNIVDGTKETKYSANTITYDTGTSGGTIELDKVATEISIGGTYFTNTMNSYNLAAGTLGQVMTTGASDTVVWKTLTNTDVGAAAASHEHSASEITSGTFGPSMVPTVYLDALTATATCSKIPDSMLPSYISSVQEYASEADFPNPGTSGVIYVSLSTNKSYRYGGTEYVEISKSLSLGAGAEMAWYGDKGLASYQHTQTQGSLGGSVSQGVYKVALSETGHVTGYAEVTKADIETICGSLGSIDTISVNGTALPITSDKDVALPISSTTTLGLAKPNGESIDAVSGVLYVKEASAADMAGRITRTVINAYNYDTAVKQALTDNANSTVAYSDADKLAVRKLISTPARADVAANYDSSIMYPEGTLVYDGDTLKRIVSGAPVAATVSDAIIAAGEKFKYHVDTDADKRPVVSAPSTTADGTTTDGYGSNAVYIQHSTGTFNSVKLTVEESEIVISKSTNNGIKFSFT